MLLVKPNLLVELDDEEVEEGLLMEDDERVEDGGGGLRGESSRPTALPRPPELAFREDEAAGGGGGGALQTPPQSSSNNFEDFIALSDVDFTLSGERRLSNWFIPLRGGAFSFVTPFSTDIVLHFSFRYIYIFFFFVCFVLFNFITLRGKREKERIDARETVIFT